MPRDNLYFIAIVAPEAVAAEINAFKYDIRDYYNSKAALKTMPHITLKAPFKLPAEGRTALFEWFANIPTAIAPFPVVLKDFECFNNKYNKVIYVKSLMSPELIALQSDVVNSFSAAYPKINMSAHEREFSPHMTIGYRDLTPENFEKAWAVYKDRQYTSAFICNSFCLLQHNGLRWEIAREKYLV